MIFAFFASLKVDKDSLNDSTAGDMQNIITHFPLPFNELSNNLVNLESRYGMCPPDSFTESFEITFDN